MDISLGLRSTTTPYGSITSRPQSGLMIPGKKSLVMMRPLGVSLRVRLRDLTFGHSSKADDCLEARTATLSVENVNKLTDSGYAGTVSVGTPPQQLKVLFDTGSPDFWIFSSDLDQADAARAAHEVFEPKASSSFQNFSASEDESWNITYVDGAETKGYVGQDTVNIGGIVVQNQEFGLATHMSDDFYNDKSHIDGIFGLALSRGSRATPVKLQSAIDNMVSRSLLEQSIFTAKMVAHGDGQYTFGFINETELVEPVRYTDLVYSPAGLWKVWSPRATIAGNVTSRPGNMAFIDTGTTLNLVDDDFLKAIYANVSDARFEEEAGAYLVPTGTNGTTVEIAIGDNLVQIPAKTLAWAPAEYFANMSYGSFQSRGNLPVDLLGECFIKNVLAVFDPVNLKFGVARRKDVIYD